MEIGHFGRGYVISCALDLSSGGGFPELHAMHALVMAFRATMNLFICKDRAIRASSSSCTMVPGEVMGYRFSVDLIDAGGKDPSGTNTLFRILPRPR